MKIRYTALVFLFSTALLLTGCAGNSADASVPQSNKVAVAPPTRVTPPPTATVARSVFAIEKTSRDPFFPQAKKVAADTSGGTRTEPEVVDISGVLSSGLQGIGGTAERRIAVIHNVIVESGRSTVISIPSGNQTRTVPVRCREITRDSVLLDVEGYGPVVVTRKQVL